MKLAELLFDEKMNVSGIKVWFGNITLDIETLKAVWSFLNQDIKSEDPIETPIVKKKPGRPKKVNTEEKRKPGRPKKVTEEETSKREKDIDAIKKAVAERKNLG